MIELTKQQRANLCLAFRLGRDYAQKAAALLPYHKVTFFLDEDLYFSVCQAGVEVVKNAILQNFLNLESHDVAQFFLDALNDVFNFLKISVIESLHNDGDYIRPCEAEKEPVEEAQA